MAAHRAAKRLALPAELTDKARWVRSSASKVPFTAEGSSVGVGLGFVLSDEDDIVCVDLDYALDAGGQPLPWAADVLRSLPETYIEVSRSGRGLHVFGFADVRQGRRIRRAGGEAIEVYGQQRFIAVTGQRFKGSPVTLADINAAVRDLTA